MVSTRRQDAGTSCSVENRHASKASLQNNSMECSHERRLSSRATRSSVKKKEQCEDNNVNERGLMHEEEHRRSSRHRKLLYDTFDQTAIAAQTLGHIPSRRNQVPQDEQHDGMEVDMYTRVKRTRRQVKRDIYGMPIPEEESKSTEDEEVTTENDEDVEEDEEQSQENGVQYNLRQNKPQTKLYEATIEKKSKSFFKDRSPKKRYGDRHVIEYKSPAHRTRRRKKAAFNKNSSTSSSGSESEDERKFERRKKKSMARSRQRCLPMNLMPNEMTGVMKDRQKIGASLADIDPMSLDRSVTFASVGGLVSHIQALKEMIVFPLVYPEVFERFKIAPPRGVLFHGPPGTGKTLVARALANECSRGDKRVSFFMRKGADCLSKWVGESERQLRLLFDQAYQMRPSIIFFDEIDGLAPVRSSRQDQIHSSIVSTLLALMDGLDSRGEVVVIGATNRIDSIDPALRRPGRFDREFLFSLPSAEARAQILKIHTTEWNPQLLDSFIKEVAAKCNGYCGADMKALCTEASLHALRRRYPQIYTSEDKLQLDVTSIDINAADFYHAITKIVPAGQRAVATPGRPLSFIIKPLLQEQFKSVLNILNRSFPFAAQTDLNGASAMDNLLEIVDDDRNAVTISETKKKQSQPAGDSSFLDFNVAAYRTPIVNRPRLCLCGSQSQGHSTHLAPAILHYMEGVPTHVLDLPALYANSSRTPEESCAHIFREARRSTPSIIYIPHVDKWWQVLSDTMRATFLMLSDSLDPLIPILMIATSESSAIHDGLLSTIFNSQVEMYQMEDPDAAKIRLFFEDLLLHQTCIPPPSRKKAARNLLEVLPKAPAPKPAQLTDTEKKALWDHEESVLRELRVFLRDILNKLARDRKFNIFAKPVDYEDVPDYYEIITHPMDLHTMMSKIDLHQYETVQNFLEDITLICQNALEYNPDTDPAGRAIRHRACALKDMAYAIVDAELDQEFEKQCLSIQESRKNRGASPNKIVPKYYHTRPLPVGAGLYSKKLRGEDAVETHLETGVRLSRRSDSSNHRDRLRSNENFKIKLEEINRLQRSGDRKNAVVKSPPKRSRYVSPWVRKSRRRKRKRQNYESEELDVLAASINGSIPEDLVMEHETLPTSEEESKSTEKIETTTPPEQDITVEKILHVRRDLTLTLKESSGSVTEVDAERSVEERTTEDESSANPPMVNGYDSSHTDEIQIVVEEKDNLENECRNLEKDLTEVQRNIESKKTMDTCLPSPVIIEEVHELAPTSTIRKTRSMTCDPTIVRCMEIIEEPLPVFTINEAALPALLDKVVTVTCGANIAQLEKLYSQLAQNIFLHRKSYDRKQLLLDLKSTIESFKLT